MSKKTFCVTLPMKGTNLDIRNVYNDYANYVRGAATPSLFSIPPLKVGSLDSLMELSDDLMKSDTQVESVTFKMLNFLHDVSEHPEKADSAIVKTTAGEQKRIDEYVAGFKWSETRYPSSKPLKTLVQSIQDKVFKAEETVRSKLGEYNEIRTRIANIDKRSKGSLAVKPVTKDIHEWYKRKPDAVNNAPVESEYLTTIFVAVPNPQKKEWERGYMSLGDLKFIVPDSSQPITQDSEYTLYNVVVFRRIADNFKNECRQKRYVIREYNPEEEIELGQLEGLKGEKDTKKNQLTMQLQTTFSECYIGWIHLKAIRLFVESILRYGLPPQFVCLCFMTDSKKEKEIRKSLDSLITQRTLLSRPALADEDAADTSALEQQFAYVSLKIASPLH